LVSSQGGGIIGECGIPIDRRFGSGLRFIVVGLPAKVVDISEIPAPCVT
jgi:hypothetical protein